MFIQDLQIFYPDFFPSRIPIPDPQYWKTPLLFALELDKVRYGTLVPVQRVPGIACTGIVLPVFI
jgi:hypothetical protein